MTEDKEVEIQVQIENKDLLMDFLEKEAKFVGEKHQVDNYFCPAHKNFTAVRPVKEWVRLRDSTGEFSINYKNWHFGADGKSQYCDEYETPVENLEQLEKILKMMEMKKSVTVDKIRKIYRYKDYEIAIDMVVSLGDFVEVEYKGKIGDRDPKEITSEMVAWLKQIGCGRIVRNYVGYPFQMMFGDEVRREEV